MNGMTMRQLEIWVMRAVQVAGELARARAERRSFDLEDLAWLEVFDDDDLNAFRSEVDESFVRALAADSTDPVEECVLDWRVTAQALSSPARRRILVGDAGAEGFMEVAAPGSTRR